MVLCDSFNIPLVMLVDQPGFLIGLEGEQKGVTGKVMNWLNAMTLCTVPKISIIVRKSYGLAVSNMGAGGNADEVCCWVTAEVSFMKPEFGAKVVFGVTEDDPEQYAAAVAQMNKGSTPYNMAAIYTAQNVHRSARHARVSKAHARSASAAPDQRRRRASDAHLADELLTAAGNQNFAKLGIAVRAEVSKHEGLPKTLPALLYIRANGGRMVLRDCKSIRRLQGPSCASARRFGRSTRGIRAGCARAPRARNLRGCRL